jgi:heme/copper-type cytochrome/quinol oxidase subunit 2
MLDYSSSKQGGTSAAVAINAMAIAIGGIISGALGSTFASLFAGVHFEIPALHFVVTYHVLLMLLVVFVRLIVCVMIMRLEETKATPTRDLLRDVSTGIFHNTRQAILMPTRIVGQMGRWTYKMRQND